ncbi:MAG: hypothetical protein E7439_03790 [Ruminococcaceae bacterium]|nr:hypothetical protein [Oscillospiraceae bacterium]
MKKLITAWKRLPRPVRTIVHVIVILLCIGIAYIAIGIPFDSAEAQFRRLEQSHMIGPSDILGTETISVEHRQKLLIAESDSNVMLYRYYIEDEVNSIDLVCRAKTGKLTVLAAGGQRPSHSGINIYDIDLPVVLFDDYPNAVRAELDITLIGDYINDKYDPEKRYERTYNLEATRSNPGYFYFLIHHEAYTNSRDPALLQRFAEISSGYDYRAHLHWSVPVAVRLYDNQENLIHEETVYIRSYAAEVLLP